MPLHPIWLERARLWLILDRHAAQPRRLEEVTAQCIAGGVDAVLCRIKDLPQAEVRPMARLVREVCGAQRIPFIMSHDMELAGELAADGIQLGVDDRPLDQVRCALPAGTVIGSSTHSVAEALTRKGEGADYVFLGPVFPTPAKLKYGNPLGLTVVHEALGQLAGYPIVFIGGINLGNLPEMLGLGVTRVAAIAALQAQPDPQAAAAAFKQLLARTD